MVRKATTNGHSRAEINFITETQKKVALLLGKLELEGSLKGRGFTKDTRVLVGRNTINNEGSEVYVTKDYLNRWSKGENRQGGWSDLSSAIANRYNIIDFDSGEITSHDILDGPIGTMEFGEKINLTRGQCHYFIDSLFGDLLPSLNHFSVRYERAKKFIGQYGGLYRLYRIDKRESSTELYVTCIPLAVRYLIGSTKHSASGLYRIRCKMHVPNHRKGIEPFEFDGSVVRNDQAWYWVFETRLNVLPTMDLHFLTTEYATTRSKKLTMRGQMISSNQSDKGTSTGTAHWPVFIVKDENFETISYKGRRGIYEIIDKRSPEIGDAETTFFKDNCYSKEISDFDDNWVLHNLMKEQVNNR